MLATYLSVATVIISSLTLIVTAWSLWFTQARTDVRELSKWKREELLKLTAVVMQASSQRQNSLSDSLSRLEVGLALRTRDGEPTTEELAETMLLAVGQIELLDERTAVAAREVYELHRKAEREWYPSGGDFYRELDDLMVAPSELETKHAALVQAFQLSTQPVKRRRFWRWKRT